MVLFSQTLERPYQKLSPPSLTSFIRICVLLYKTEEGLPPPKENQSAPHGHTPRLQRKKGGG